MSGPQRGDTGAPQAAQWGPVTGSPVPSWAVGSIPGATDPPTGYPPAGDGPAGYGMTGPGAQAGTGSARTGRSPRWGVAKVLAVAVIALGLLNFIWGFLPELSLSRSTTTQGSLSVFSIGPAYVPILLLTAGLLALTAFLPSEERASFAVAVVSSGGAIGAIVSLGSQDAVSGFGQVSKGMGAILLVIFGIIQAVVALTAFVIGSGFGLNPRAAEQRPGNGGQGLPAPTGATAAAFPVAGSGTGQQYPGQWWSAPPAPWGAPADRPDDRDADRTADRGGGWRPAGHGAVQAPSAYPVGPVPALWEPSRSAIPPSADARSADTDPQGIPVIDTAEPSAGAEAVVAGPGEPGDDRRPADAAADRDPTRDS